MLPGIAIRTCLFASCDKRATEPCQTENGLFHLCSYHAALIRGDAPLRRCSDTTVWVERTPSPLDDSGVIDLSEEG